MATPFSISPQYAEMLASFQQKLQQALMDADYEEQSRRRSYENDLFNLGEMRRKGAIQNTVNLADRGLGRSGIALQAEADLNQGFDREQAGFGQEFDSALTALARKRLGAHSGFAEGAAGLMRQTAAGINPMAYRRQAPQSPNAQAPALAPPPPPTLATTTQAMRPELMRLASRVGAKSSAY